MSYVSLLIAFVALIVCWRMLCRVETMNDRLSDVEKKR